MGEEVPDDRIENDTEGFVESDYEVKDELEVGDKVEDEPEAGDKVEEQANFGSDFGFELYDGQEVRDYDTDNRESHELRSLDSEEDE